MLYDQVSEQGSSLLHADHIVVDRLTAADVADLNVVGAFCLDDLGHLLGILVGDIAAGDDGDEAGILLAHTAGQTIGGLGDVVGGEDDLAVLQSHDLALPDPLAVVLAVAGGVGDEAGGDLIGGRHHVDGVGLDGSRGVEVQQSGDAHGDGAGGQNDHLTVSQLLGLLSSHDDVLVVGQNEDGLGRDALDGGKDVLGGGIHGLTAGDDSVSGQVGEDSLQALTGGDSNEAIVAAGVNGSVDELAGGVGLLLGGSLLLEALALLLAGQELLVHILDLEVGEVAVLDGLAQDLAGVGGVDMEVDDVIVLDADDAVAVGLGEGAHLCGACALVLVDEELGAVAVLDVLDLHQVVGEDALAGVLGGELGLVGDSLAAGHDVLTVEDLAHALEDDHDALAAGVHDAGLLQDGQQVGSVLQSLLTGGHHDVPQLGHILFAAGSSFLGGDAGDGQDGAFGGLHDSLVSALDALLQCSHDVGGVSLLFALQSFGEAAEQQAGDDAGVAAGAAQHGGGGGLCGLAHGAAVVHGLQLTDG